MTIRQSAILVIAIIALSGALLVDLASRVNGRLEAIETTWNDYHDSFTPRAAQLAGLYASFGYGGMIHHFKNYVLRREARYFDDAVRAYGGVVARLAEARASAAPGDLPAVETLQATADEYFGMMTRAQALAAQGDDSRAIDRLVKVDDGPAERAFAQLAASIGLDERSAGGAEGRAQLLAQLWREFGYGRMIHDLKNFVLRADTTYGRGAQNSINLLRELLASYRELELSEPELAAVAAIEGTVDSYEAALQRAWKAVSDGKPPEAIDALVRVDDGPAFVAFGELRRGIFLEEGVTARELTQALEVSRNAAGQTIKLVVLLATGSSLLILLVMLRYVTVPLQRVLHNISKLEQDEFRLNLPLRRGTGELARVERALGKLAERLHENQRNREALAAERARYRNLFEASPDGLLTFDEDGQILLVNPELCRLTGFEADELVGKPLRWLLHDVEAEIPESWTMPALEGWPASLAPIAQAPRRVATTYEVETANGNRFLAEVTVSPGNAQGSALAAIRDITEKESYRGHLLAFAEALEQKNIRLERANEELEQFAYVASHDLQEPLRTVRSSVAVVREEAQDKLSGDSAIAFRFIEESCERMSALIFDILDYSRIGRTGEPELVDLNELVAGIITDLSSRIEAAEGNVTVSPLPKVRAIPYEMRTLFQNLIGNALKYVPKDRAPSVHVHWQDYEGGDRFAITDNGIGIAQSHADKVFQIFQRLHSRSEYDGTGIGLACCQKIVREQGGRIWFESTPGEGSTFYFTWPRS